MQVVELLLQPQALAVGLMVHLLQVSFVPGPLCLGRRLVVLPLHGSVPHDLKASLEVALGVFLEQELAVCLTVHMLQVSLVPGY